VDNIGYRSEEGMEAFLEKKGWNDVDGASGVRGGEDSVRGFGRRGRGKSGEGRWRERRLDKVRIHRSSGMEEGGGELGYLAIEE
jgi:hypothetical protein